MTVQYKLTVSEGNRERFTELSVDFHLKKNFRVKIADPHSDKMLPGIGFRGQLRVNDDSSYVEFSYAVKNPLISTLVISAGTAVGTCVAYKLAARFSSLVAKRWKMAKGKFEDREGIYDELPEVSRRIEDWSYYILKDFENGVMSDEFSSDLAKELYSCAFGKFATVVRPWL